MATAADATTAENDMDICNILIKPDPDDNFYPSMSDFDESIDIELRYFTQDDLACIKKCVDNMNLIIKDYETQLDWHLQQYMTLRNASRRQGRTSTRADLDYLTAKGLLKLTSLSNLMKEQDGNPGFVKRKLPAKKKGGKRTLTSEEEDTDLSDSDLEDAYGVSEEEDEPPKKRSKTIAKKSSKPIRPTIVVKDEIEEEYNELIVPKDEIDSEIETSPVVKRGRKKAPAPKKTEQRTHKKIPQPIDPSSMKTCSVILQRVDEGNRI